ncbi:MAG: hypothetical protein ACLPKB_20215 [Xanthobacteraceae bacterium]
MSVQPSTTQATARPLRFAGKSAIISVSTGGIGLGIARAAAESGANVMLNGLGQPDEI